jgi:hypothetical protein
MALSKRLRYEILRRDGHACRYCGMAAPDARLTVDHVVPTTLGGSDDPSNLVAACHDCNAGKSASAPDAPFVANVNEEALLWRQLTEAAAHTLRANRDAEEALVGHTFDIWDRLCGRWSIPHDAANTVRRWHARGVLPEDITYAAEVTADSRGVAYHWSYFCGVVNRHLRERDDLAQQWMREARTDI